MRFLQFAALAASLTTFDLPTQSTPTAFVTTTGKDTFCFEQYARRGNVVTGTWVVMHSPGVYVHDYTITLNDDGLPTQYTMKYSVPTDPKPPELDSLIVTYGRDSATLSFIGKDSSFTRRLAMHEAFPLLGQSLVGVELALQRMRRMHVDSTTITLHPPSQPDSPIRLAPVRFLGADSVIVLKTPIHVTADGRILAFKDGRIDVQRVGPIDVRALTDGFVKEFAPRRAPPGR